MRQPWHVANSLGCPMRAALNVIGGKWKPIILHILGRDGEVRFSALVRRVPGLRHKVLAAQLRELSLDGVVERLASGDVPPQVAYRLTDRGRALAPVLDGLYRWGEAAGAGYRGGSGA